MRGLIPGWQPDAPSSHNTPFHSFQAERTDPSSPVSVQDGKSVGKEPAGTAAPPPPPTHPALSPYLLSGHTPHPAQGSRPGICLQQASELQAFALGRCLLGDPTCGHELRQEAFVSSHLLPSGAHSILKWQLKEGPWWADTGYYECPLAPCPHSNPSFLDRCDFRWPFLQVAQTCFSLHCPRQTKRRGLAPMLILQSRRKGSPLGKSSVSRGKGAQASPTPDPRPLHQRGGRGRTIWKGGTHLG